MPNAKRLKKSGAKQTKQQPSEPEADRASSRPTPAEVEEQEHQFVQVARSQWLKGKATRTKVKNDVVKQSIWDVLEREGFAYKSLLLLESLQTLEGYAAPSWWPRTIQLLTMLTQLSVAWVYRGRLELSCPVDSPDR
jgi:intron-binding protein aquarius